MGLLWHLSRHQDGYLHRGRRRRSRRPEMSVFVQLRCLAVFSPPSGKVGWHEYSPRSAGRFADPHISEWAVEATLAVLAAPLPLLKDNI